ncbi:MAG: hypothetical protein WC485_03530 [Opitutaceae bacterium]
MKPGHASLRVALVGDRSDAVIAHRAIPRALAAIRFARETGRPFLGICGGRSRPGGRPPSA